MIYRLATYVNFQKTFLIFSKHLLSPENYDINVELKAKNEEVEHDCGHCLGGVLVGVGHVVQILIHFN